MQIGPHDTGWQFDNVSQNPNCTFVLTQQFYFQEEMYPSDALLENHKDTCPRVFISVSFPTTKRPETSHMSIKTIFDTLVIHIMVFYATFKTNEGVCGGGCSWVAQLVEHVNRNIRVVSSGPTLGPS